MSQPHLLDPHYIVAPTAPPREPERVLKQGDSFVVCGASGDIRETGMGEQGLFHRGTRHLARLELLVEGARAILLSSSVRQDDGSLAVDLTNPDLMLGERLLPRETVHLFLAAVLLEGVLHVRLRARSYAMAPLTLGVAVRFAADFVDIFEVRGSRRPKRGVTATPQVAGDRVTLAYDGLDGVRRTTELSFAPPPEDLTASGAAFRLDLLPDGEVDQELTVRCLPGAGEKRRFDAALERRGKTLDGERRERAQLVTDSAPLRRWLARSTSDLDLMLVETPFGLYPHAGVPWFATPFGRDGIVTAFELLPYEPAVARGVLRFLAATQATELDPARDAEPGKILHEARDGEMAALREVPFGRYYGSVDATPLFVMLAGAYWTRTADRETVTELWPSVLAALRWLDDYGDPDGDGLVEYVRRSSDGLVSQGWKDSTDSVFHRDGSLAEPPVALCEVQGYVVGARLAGAALAELVGESALAARLRQQAEVLRARIETHYWDEELDTYVLALDGRKRPCRVRTSNPGHLLWAGAVDLERGASVATQLMHDASFSGWGIRTVAAGQSRYNPMSYHDGSVWPHDNALAGLGMAQYGRSDLTARLLHGLLEASAWLPLHRMPELFCGFHRRQGVGPVAYPLACAPQAWAAGAVYMLLTACIGLEIDAPASRVKLSRPVLPEGLDRLELRQLEVAGGRLDVVLERRGDDVTTLVERRAAGVEIVHRR